MKDLYRCLNEYSLPLLQAISDAWRVPLPDDDLKALVNRLAEAMLEPGAAKRLVEDLSAGAREALETVLMGDGVVPGHRLSLNYGSIRRLGPAAIDREMPWLTPDSALEELYYKGLLYRAYAAVGEYHGEVYFVPQALWEPLSGVVGESALDRLKRNEPSSVRSDPRALMEDMLVALVFLRRTRLSASNSEGERRAPLASLLQHLGPRLSGSDAESLALVWRLLWRSRLIHEEDGRLQPSLRARDWLRLPDRRRARGLVRAWRTDPYWDDLARVPSLRCDDSAGRASPLVARHNLLSVLAVCPEGVWLSLDALVAHVKRVHPDYMRPDGDFDGLDVRDAQSGERLSGFASWERVEGALARHAVSSTLHRLGVVALGYDGEGSPPVAFRISAERRAWLAQDEALQLKEGKPEMPATATVAPSFAVTIPLEGTLYERYQLERFAEWLSQDGAATFRITPDSIWKSQDEGIKIEQVLSFLGRIGRGGVPDVVTRTLRAWGGRFGRVFIRKAAVLRTDDARTMEQLRDNDEISALLGEALGPTTCLVEEAQVQPLTELLKTLGIWPHVQL